MPSHREEYEKAKEEGTIPDEDACQLEGMRRAHKFHWKLDIATGMPHPYEAICINCGVEKRLSRKDYGAGGHG